MKQIVKSKFTDKRKAKESPTRQIFDKIIQWDNSTGDYNHLFWDFIDYKELSGEFKEFLKEFVVENE